MNKKNPIKQALLIEDDFSRYIKSTFDIRDQEYRKLFYEELAKMETSLYKGPFLCSTLPFKKANTIDELIDLGNLHPKFKLLGGIDKVDYKLYQHQVDAIKRIESGKSVVVTTGTGSGKTECFVYPILDSIIKEIENGNKDNGVRAIFLFPMNALINDQIDRLRILLSTYPNIKFGFYTGETPEKSFDDSRNLYFEKYGKNVSENEILSREEMRKNPPHILFTNYSMLEYLLLRPDDAQLISPKALKYWKYVVLDEAHTYKGALGMEISALLRRLAGVAGHYPQFILTSATLGKGEESANEIVDFARSLTSTNFEKSDVIFSSRYNFTDHNDIRYRIEWNDYIYLLDNINDLEKFKVIFEKYTKYDNSCELKCNLYNLLSHDGNTFDLYLYSASVELYQNILRELQIADYECLTALIELIQKSISIDGYRLYDIKYHMFVKAPDGAFITLGKNKKLSLLECKYIDGQKAFKIGICANCKTPYVMGITENIAGENYLQIDDHVDIDELSLEEINNLVEYYLIADCLTQSEIDVIENDNDHYKKYYVCQECGHIRKAKDAKANKCEHGESSEVILYKYEEEQIKDGEISIYSNNLKKCPLCEYQTKTGGVVMGFHIGKDRATALLAQILYRNMNCPQIVDEQKTQSFFSSPYKDGVKQFIAFSDARQQAAFFDKFVDSNDARMLKYNLIWRELSKESNNDEPIKYCDLASRLSSIYGGMFGESDQKAYQYGHSAALWELLNVDGNNSAEGLGLFAFVLNLPNEYYGLQLDSIIKSKGFDVTAEEFRQLTRIALNKFRVVPAIKHVPLAQKEQELEDLLSYRHYNNYVVKQLQYKENLPKQYVNKVASFLPIKGKSNGIVKYAMKAFDLSSSEAIDLLDLVYDIAAELIFQRTDNKFDQISADNYSVYSYKNKKYSYYKCNKCGSVTIYNIRNCCVNPDCKGNLLLCDVDEYFANNYYRNEYKNRPLERIKSKEHTGQINHDDAKIIQQEFKDKKINIISCSTTFEMGIDLDQLDTVFMRNIPPSPANYVQRAGRAGRRSDTSAFVLTFCSVSSHDYTFFNNPINMIAGVVDPPHFAVDNDKIIIRHIIASALSFYIRKNPDCFESVKMFKDGNHLNKFIDYLHENDQKLIDYINNFVLFGESLKTKFGGTNWISAIEDASTSNLVNMVQSIDEQLDSYNTAIEYLKNTTAYIPNKWRLIDQYEEQSKKLEERNSLIPYLAKYGVIPRYGFPVDLVRLYVYDVNAQKFDESNDLNRDLSIAISEYAPESEIIVQKVKYTSRYIHNTHPNASYNKKYYCTCDLCMTPNVFDVEQQNTQIKCKYCNANMQINAQTQRSYIIPDKGFVADHKNKQTRTMKPIRSYSSEVKYIGTGIDPVVAPFDIADVIYISEYKNEELLILNENNFFYCPTCGYTVLDKKSVGTEKIVEHVDYRTNPCPNKKLFLTSLGHSYRTDVVKLKFVGIPQMANYDAAISCLYALLEGMSNALDIDRNDINGMVYRTSSNIPYDIILFDTVPGGAGHVKRLEEQKDVEKVLLAALTKVSQNCCSDDTACYNCLKNYSNQRYHSHLNKGLAKETLSEIIDAVQSKDQQYTVNTISIKLTDIKKFDATVYLDPSELEPFGRLVNSISANHCCDLTGCYVILENGNHKQINVDFYWEEANTLLFTHEHLADYNVLKDGQSKYNCFLLDDAFDEKALVNTLKI